MNQDDIYFAEVETKNPQESFIKMCYLANRIGYLFVDLPKVNIWSFWTTLGFEPGSPFLHLTDHYTG